MALQESFDVRAAAPQRRGRPSEWLSSAERQTATTKSLGRGLWLTVLHYGLYFATMAGAVAPFPVAVNVLFGIANGVLIGLLFILGHDATHSTLVPGTRMNAWLARLVFLPSLHSRSLWEVFHNRGHHRFTNLIGKGRDFAWAPMSKARFDAASPLRQRLERLYRSPAGPFVYYWTELWAPKLVAPWSAEARHEWRQHMFDTVFVVALGGALIALAGVLGAVLTPERPLGLSLLLGWFIPFETWNYAVSIVVYLQHTHPAIPWYDDEREWSFYEGQIRATTEVDLPAWFPTVLKWVMQHTAHHALPSVPIYKLTEAQAKLAATYDGDVVRYRFHWRDYLQTCRVCKLFDYRSRQWIDFNGRPTSPVIGSRPDSTTVVGAVRTARQTERAAS